MQTFDLIGTPDLESFTLHLVPGGVSFRRADGSPGVCFYGAVPPPVALAVESAWTERARLAARVAELEKRIAELEAVGGEDCG